MAEPSRVRRFLVNVLRVAVSAAMLVVAVRMIDVRDAPYMKLPDGRYLPFTSFHEANELGARVEFRPGLLSVLKSVNVAWLPPLVLSLVVSIAALSWRWWTLLRANGFEVPYRRVFTLLYVGAFFNQILPGAVGGDAVRMYFASRDEQRKAAAAATVALDRLIGLVTMIVVASIAVIPLIRTPELRIPVITVASLATAAVLGTLLYFSPLGRRLRGALPFQKQVQEIDGVLHSIKHGPRTLALAVAQSLIAQFTAVFVVYGLALALGIRVGILPFLLFEVLIFILVAVPISVGGWGVQEVAYAQLFALAGVPPNEAVALSVLFKLAGLVISLPGGLLFALGVHRRP